MVKLQSNPIVFFLLNGILYLFYGLLLGLALFPPICCIGAYINWGTYAMPHSLPFFALLALCIGASIYLFLFFGLLIFGVAERLLSLGFKPGKYPLNSLTFVRWLVYSGVHIISLNLFLPLLQGSDFSRVFYRIIGCKMGKNVFINTVGLHDAYLLEIGDNVVIGGKTDITCHLFEDDHLLLGRIKIGNNVLIGANCYIAPGTSIGDHCNIGTNSLVRKDKRIENKTMLLHLHALPARQIIKLLSLSREKVRGKPLKNE